MGKDLSERSITISVKSTDSGVRFGKCSRVRGDFSMPFYSSTDPQLNGHSSCVLTDREKKAKVT
jgi:hypothetical protein